MSPKIGTSTSISRVKRGVSLRQLFDWYVSSINGADGNSGTSKDDAFDSLDDVPTLQDGEVVALDKGSFFRSQLKTSTPNVEVRPYGSGDIPEINGTEVVSGWTQNGTYSNVWEAQVTPNQDFAAGGALMLFKNDTRLRRATSVQDVSNNGGWYADDFSPSGPSQTTIYVQSASDPGGTGDTFECSLDDHGIDLLTGADGATIEGPITLSRHFGHYGPMSVTDCDNVVLKKLLLVDGNIHNVVTSGILTEDCIALYGDPDNPGISFTAYRPDPTGFDHTFRRCWVIGNDALREAAQDAFYAHGSGNPWDNVRWVDCYVYKAGTTRAATSGQKEVVGGYFREAYNTFLRDVPSAEHVTFRTVTNDSRASAPTSADAIASSGTITGCVVYGGGLEADSGDPGFTLTNCVSAPSANVSPKIEDPGTCSGNVIDNTLVNIQIDTAVYSGDRNIFLDDGNAFTIDGGAGTFSDYRSQTSDTTSKSKNEEVSGLEDPSAVFLGDRSDGDFRLDPDLSLFDEGQGAYGNLGPQKHRRLDGTEVDGPRCHWPAEVTSRANLEQHLQELPDSSFTSPALSAAPTDVQVRPKDGETLVTWRPPDTQNFTEQIVERSGDGGATWTEIASFDGPETRYYYRDTGVTNGSDYQYRVKVNDN